MVDNEEDDTVSFDMVNTFIFRPDLTKGLTGNEIVTIPHLLIMVSWKKLFSCFFMRQTIFCSHEKFCQLESGPQQFHSLYLD